MLNIIYCFIISPIEMLVEMTYSVMHRIFDNCGIAILAVSFVVQTLVLPLYKRADKLQEEERQRQKDMSYWVQHIKRTFRGDERFMMLSTYYREKNYKQWYTIISSASILLQIPFFMAAYHFLSNLTELQGQSFWFIKDLAKPDMAISLFGITINVLPIVMTAINIGSGIVYTKGFPMKEKIQVYGLAAFFLVFLYNSPSGLVLYWTMNQVYSLGKNVVMKLIAPHRSSKVEKNSWVDVKAEELKARMPMIFLSEAILLTLFMGALIPLNVVSASANEFVNASHGPMYLVISNLAVYAGIFLLWFSVFYALMTDKLRLLLVLFMTVISGVVVIDYMLVSRKSGLISPLLVYDKGLGYSNADKLINIVAIIAVSLILVTVFIVKIDAVKWIINIMIISTLVLCVINSRSVMKQVDDYNKQVAISGEDKILQFSSQGTNVIVMMLDRAISGFIPYVFKENPDIAAMYEGFTYYPNTMSFGGNTMYGSPALYGGYEYTAHMMNERSDMLLKDKHNEALMLMPTIFSDNGYEVVVCDPPYAGTYLSSPDYSMLNAIDNVNTYKTYDAYTMKYAETFAPTYQSKQESAMKYYSLMKSLPVAIQKYIYNEGRYCSKVDLAINMNFIKAYSVLLSLKEITDIKQDDSNHFLLFQNQSTHEISALKVPEYEPMEGTRNQEMDYSAYYNSDDYTIDGRTLHLDTLFQAAHYQCLVASLRHIGYWFEYLKENDCWDNTRVIIVSDHGYGLNSFDDMLHDGDVDIERYNPLLMEKDFGSDTYSVSDEFMTNGDTPSMAFEGIITNPVNPFTGNPVNEDGKKEIQYISTDGNPFTDPTAYVFDTENVDWYEVIPGDIFDFSKWHKIDR